MALELEKQSDVPVQVKSNQPTLLAVLETRAGYRVLAQRYEALPSSGRNA